MKKFLISVTLIFSHSSVSYAGFESNQFDAWTTPLIIIAIVSGLISFLSMTFLSRKREEDTDDASYAFGVFSELLTFGPLYFISRCVLFISLFMLIWIFFEEVIIAIIAILIIIFALYKILDKNKK